MSRNNVGREAGDLVDLVIRAVDEGGDLLGVSYRLARWLEQPGIGEAVRGEVELLQRDAGGGTAVMSWAENTAGSALAVFQVLLRHQERERRRYAA